MSRLKLIVSAVALLAILTGGAHAQATPDPPRANADVGAAPEPALSALALSASLGSSNEALRSGLYWRVFQERAEPDGSHAIAAESGEAAPTLDLPDGDYIVHAGFGLASGMKRVSVRGRAEAERLSLNAGVLKVTDVLGDAAIPPSRTSLAIYVPERGNAEARLVIANARSTDMLRLPEGIYRVVSTYLDNQTSGSTPAPGAALNATNSVVTAELRVQTGKLTDATLRHRAAMMTLKLVQTPGGEALASTSFSVLTPGGDVIREMIGAFPSLVLAEGEYVVIARRDGKTYQGAFTVQSTLDHDVEVLAK